MISRRMLAWVQMDTFEHFYFMYKYLCIFISVNMPNGPPLKNEKCKRSMVICNGKRKTLGREGRDAAQQGWALPAALPPASPPLPAMGRVSSHETGAGESQCPTICRCLLIISGLMVYLLYCWCWFCIHSSLTLN